MTPMLAHTIPGLTEMGRHRLARELGLSAIAQGIASDLCEAFAVNGSTAGSIDRARLRMIAERAVTLTQPSCHEDAMTAAADAQRETVAMLVSAVAQKYEDHSSALLITDALRELAHAIDRLTPAYILAAYDGALEGPR